MDTSNRVRARHSWTWLLVCVAGIAVGLTRGAAVEMRPAPSERQPTPVSEVIVRGGLIVTSEGRMGADVRVRGEKIVEIGPDLAPTAGAREIDARGMLLFPGAVDTHTHLASGIRGVRPAGRGSLSWSELRPDLFGARHRDGRTVVRRP